MIRDKVYHARKCTCKEAKTEGRAVSSTLKVLVERAYGTIIEGRSQIRAY